MHFPLLSFSLDFDELAFVLSNDFVYNELGERDRVKWKKSQSDEKMKEIENQGRRERDREKTHKFQEQFPTQINITRNRKQIKNKKRKRHNNNNLEKQSKSNHDAVFLLHCDASQKKMCRHIYENQLHIMHTQDTHTQLHTV